MPRACPAALLPLLLLAAVAYAAPAPSPATVYRTLVAADSAARAHDDAAAADGYARVIAADPTNGRARQARAWCLYRLGRFADAATAFRECMAFGGVPGRPQARAADNAYNVACCEARAGHADAALDWLGRALELGFEKRIDLAGDEDLASLRGDPRFLRLAGTAVVKGGRAAEWSADLDQLVAEVRRLNPDYRGRALPAAFDSAAAALRASLPALDDGQVVVELQSLMARLGDGHSSVVTGTGRVAVHALPVQLYAFREGLYVVGAADAYATLVGRRVTAIGGRDVAALMDGVAVLVSRDNDMGLRWLAPGALSSTEALRALGCDARNESVLIETATPAGTRERTRLATAVGAGGHHHLGSLPPAPGAPVPLWLAHAREAWWVEPLDGGRVRYVQLNRVANADHETLAAFGRRLRGELGADVTDVVVDVRHNHGGNATLLGELVRTLTAFEAAHPGHLYVITGRGTFSAAQVFVNKLEAATGAVFVGEPSSSRPDFTGETTPVVLPNSGLTVSVSSRRHHTDGEDTRTWIPVSVPAEPTAADWAAGRDPALDAVLELARAGANRPQ